MLETDTYTAAGGSVDAKTVNGPWTYTTTATQAMPGGLPALTARMPATTQARSLSLLASGSWRDHDDRHDLQRGGAGDPGRRQG